MDLTYTYAVNCGFGWLLTLLSVFGYVLTLKRTGERWLFWIVLATGWALFAIAQTVIMTGHFNNLPFLIALWLSSWVLVVVSLLLSFIKVIKMKENVSKA